MIDIIEQNGIVNIFIGDKSKKINVLTADIITLLDSYIDRVMSSPLNYPKAIIIRSVNEETPEPSFLAGADINLIASIATVEEAYNKAAIGQKLFSHIDNLPVPTFAFINGVCLGGGLELALSCDYIFVSDSESTQLGLPEVGLGIIPGFGGTQRLPKRVGYLKGIELITNTKRVRPKEAKSLGLVDAVVPHTNFSQLALSLVDDVISGKTKIEKRKRPLLDIIVTLPIIKNIVDGNVRKLILSKTKGHYNAPMKAFEVISASYPVCSNYDLEAKAFSLLAVANEAKNLMSVFQMSKAVSKYPKGDNLEYQIPAQVAVIGTGIMGNAIAATIVKKGIETRVKAIDWANANLSFAKVGEIVTGKAKRSVKSDVGTIDHLSYTVDYSGFNKVDFVIEAVFEDLPLKQQIVKDVFEMNPNAIFASNTSSLSIAEIGIAKPESTIGFHFFNPANKMPLVEVIYTPMTSPKTIKTTMEFAKKLGKTPILMKDKPGFVVNRILMPYLHEATHIMEEGISQELIDEVLVDFGMPMGPIELIDQVGIDIAYHVGNILHNAYGTRATPPSLLSYLYDNKKLGKKTKEGLYIYPATGHKLPNSYVIEKGLALASSQSKPPLVHKLTDTELSQLEVSILHRTTFAMINEASRILEEGVVDEPAKVDMAMIMGTGFPPFRGGLLKYADTIGIDFIVTKLQELSKSKDDVFAPSALLLKMQAEKSTFYR